jgi:ClpP class serine protease
VHSILIDVDSPGGDVSLVPELAAEIRAARGQKPIVAVANTFAASAAYWIASGGRRARRVAVGQVGSIGVYSPTTTCRPAGEGSGSRRRS